MLEKLSRNNRVVAITKILTENPNKIIGLNKFTELLNAAKSTISEDIVIIRTVFEKLEMGKIETIAGASGGIKFIPGIKKETAKQFADDLCELLKDKTRIIPGDFIYLTDIMYNPKIISKAGVILSTFYYNKGIDYVVTVETKGIPLAYEVSKNLGIPLVIIRRENKVTEGSTITINYVSGTSGKIQQMSLSKKLMRNKSKCIFIDDFLRGGGTAQGIKDLLSEFESELVGIAVLVDNIGVKNKRVDDYLKIVDLKYAGENKELVIKPSELINLLWKCLKTIK